jgi:GNAT superfamily N-acetyltransferase
MARPAERPGNQVHAGTRRPSARGRVAPVIATIRQAGADELRQRVAELSGVLIDCVEGGASVSFMAPLDRGRADAFWTRIADDAAAGARAVLIAELGGRLVGTVQLVLAQPDNQPHRADLAKMLVHRSARRQGIGTALMRGAEQAARRLGKTLLVLDTVQGEAGELLYARLGWVRVGAIPGYALLPRGGLCATVYYYRSLNPSLTGLANAAPEPRSFGIELS